MMDVTKLWAGVMTSVTSCQLLKLSLPNQTENAIVELVVAKGAGGKENVERVLQELSADGRALAARGKKDCGQALTICGFDRSQLTTRQS